MRTRYDIGSLAHPGQTVVTRWMAHKEGAYFAYSTAAPVGGEGDGGQIGLGLFASVNVEPAGAVWYRSQITEAELKAVTTAPVEGHPYARIDYARQRMVGGRSVPVLAMLDQQNRIVHSDLNAVVVLPEVPGERLGVGEACQGAAFGSSCHSFREFTVMFHDEVHAQQAFAELEDEDNPLSLIRDGMGINYGVSSMGSLVMSTPMKARTGPAKDCPECRAEEFFLSSWANGDPALILDYQGERATGARYPDDPSNVHHSYLGDAVRFRNLHAGPKETHVFHLHAHQWVLDSQQPASTYLDSQTISPGASFSYAIEFGGSGNRNFTPGDSIFHCHLYPHFAQGMWELWRTHDVFENGDKSRRLPDAEVGEGIATPALVPVPGSALAPMPTPDFKGYPFYIPGKPGHRPPQPVLDMDVLASAGWTDPASEPRADGIVNGGLPRHVLTGGSLRKDEDALNEAAARGGEAAQVIAARVRRQDPAALAALAGEWDRLQIEMLPHSGTPSEQTAMQFHEGRLELPGIRPVDVADPRSPGWWQPRRAYQTQNAAITGIQQPRTEPGLFYVNSLTRAPGAPYANPCPPEAPVRDYRTAFIQTELTYNRHGWFDPQGRIIVLEDDIKDIIDPATRTRLPEPLFFRANSGECINFKSSNFMPSALNVDDFQIYTPTDTIGQHIHLVKFDVTSSDGSANGFNYEDATFSPEEVRARIFAWNRHLDDTGSTAPRLAPQVHPLFRPGGSIYEAARRDPVQNTLLQRGQCPGPEADETQRAHEIRLNRDHPFCGAQRTTQRWWADPILNRVDNRDNTLRTVFTHDHLGPSSHQQHGLYAGLVIEPANSLWLRIGQGMTDKEVASLGGQDGGGARGKLLGGSDLNTPTAPRTAADPLLAPIAPRPALRLRDDGGPTSAMANIIAPECLGNADSNPLQPPAGLNHPGATPGACVPANATRREFALAIADFGIAYNTALEPINPEPRGDSMLRHPTSVRLGRRHVASTPARPLGISSEDPGSQYVNYRHEPLALRLSEQAENAALGGFDYRQATGRAVPGDGACRPGDTDCLGDPANGFSTHVHAARDRELALAAHHPGATALTLATLRGSPDAARVDPLLASIEQWRHDFTCALYREDLLPTRSAPGEPGCEPRIARNEPWREFGDPATPILPTFEGDSVQIRLIQGAQEAQHIFAMNGVKWSRLPGSADGQGFGFTNAQPIGISEHFEFDVTVLPLDASHVDRLYFGSSVDQLWDGLWGIMRSFPAAGGKTQPVRTSASPQVQFTPSSLLGRLPGAAPAPRPADDRQRAVCQPPAEGAPLSYKVFDVSAARVCDLLGQCGGPSPAGLRYSRRFGISDEKAVVYVLNREPLQCSPRSATEGCGPPDARSNAQVLDTLRAEFAAGRPIEPLVMRAAAGQCLEVTLRNHLPATLDDGPGLAADGKPAEVQESQAYHNFLPMITDGFNLNQFRMSSSVGLSAPRVAQHPIWADGSNVGLNGAVRDWVDDPHAPPAPGTQAVDPVGTARGASQGSLVPPCTLGDSSRCRQTFWWSATDFEHANQPVELGALPLASFGDPIKHPMHGLGGALVIGPQGAGVCADDRFATARRRGYGDTVPGGVSAEICDAEGRHLYVDHVLMMQDAVNATRGGMPVGNLSGAEEPDDYGMKALNYRTEPLWARRGGDPSVPFELRNEMDYSQAMSSRLLASGRCAAGIAPLPSLSHPCDPETPVLSARPGETVRLHVVHPGGHTRQQGLALSGHGWNPYPWSADSRRFDAANGSSIRQGVFNAFGPMMGISLEVTAGGGSRVAMDYLFRSQASFLFDGGLWALLRVRADEPARRP